MAGCLKSFYNIQVWAKFQSLLSPPQLPPPGVLNLNIKAIEELKLFNVTIVSLVLLLSCFIFPLL